MPAHFTTGRPDLLDKYFLLPAQNLHLGDFAHAGNHARATDYCWVLHRLKHIFTGKMQRGVLRSTDNRILVHVEA